MDSNLRNFKDFLTLYNKVTELCFLRCVNNLNERELTGSENGCVDKCVTKFARFNQTMMGVYVEVQSQINEKRSKEMEENQRLAAQAELEQQKENTKQPNIPAVSATQTITS